MRVDKYLLSQGLSESRSKAVHLIKTGQVQVNDSICTKQSYNVKASDVVEAKAPFKHVSRVGATKGRQPSRGTTSTSEASMFWI
jgi:predicted rRNA methylase YqxC with S4 and FtsJ domains